MLVYFAECRDGTGSRAIENWVEQFASSKQMESELRKGFEVGAHKAFWLVRMAERVKILLVSQLPDALAEKCRLSPTSEPDSAVAAELLRLDGRGRIAYMPNAGITLPVPPAERQDGA